MCGGIGTERRDIRKESIFFLTCAAPETPAGSFIKVQKNLVKMQTYCLNFAGLTKYLTDPYSTAHQHVRSFEISNRCTIDVHQYQYRSWPKQPRKSTPHVQQYRSVKSPPTVSSY